MRSSLVDFLNVTKLGFNPDKALEMNPDFNILTRFKTADFGTTSVLETW